MKTTPLVAGALIILCLFWAGCQDHTLWTYELLPCPQVDSLTPNSAPFGETITVKGHDFNWSNPKLYEVLLDNTPTQAEILRVPDTQTLLFRVPHGMGSGKISVRLKDGDCSGVSDKGKDFTYRYTAVQVNPFVGTLDDSSCPDCLFFPMGLDVDATGNVWVADQLNHVVRKFSPGGGLLSTIGRYRNPGCDPSSFPNPTAAPFHTPMDVAVNPEGNIFVTEKGSAVVRQIAGSDGTVNPFSGTCNDFQIAGGPCNNAKYGSPVNLVSDQNLFYVVDAGTLRKISTGLGCQVTSVVSSGISARAIEVNRSRPGQGPLFVADLNTKTIKAFNEMGISTLMTLSGESLGMPVALASDDQGNLFVADQDKHIIYNLAPNGNVSKLAGTGVPGFAGGDGEAAQFDGPSGLAFHKEGGIKMLYVSDSNNHLIRVIILE